MVSFEDQYYDINRVFLTMIGLWPYKKWRYRVIQIVLFLSTIVSFHIAQLATFVTSELNTDVVLKILSQLCPCSISLLKYNIFLLNSERIKNFYERIRYEWIILKNADEVNILRKYTVVSRQFTSAITAVMSLLLAVFIVYQFTPLFLDVIAPLNESRKCYLPFTVEYFMDQDQYFNFFLLHGTMVIFVGSFAIITTGGMLMGYILHICAMLKIASYRLEHINDKIPLMSSSEKDHIIRERIINAVGIQRRAIEFAELILSSFAICYFILIGIGISSLTINLFQLFKSLVYMHDMNGIILCSIMIIIHITYIFVANLAGQIITDHNIDIFNTTYTTRWYRISLQAQKMLLFVMQKNTRNYYFIVGGIFNASLEGFTTMASMSITYFTMICSTR